MKNENNDLLGSLFGTVSKKGEVNPKVWTD